MQQLLLHAVHGPSLLLQNWSHVLYLKWQNCEIYIAII